MRRRGFTLMETVLSLSIVAVVAGSIAPAMSGASDVYAQTRRVREDADAAAFALDAVVRMLREAPLGEEGGGDFTVAGPSGFVFGTGVGVELAGEDLVRLEPGAPPALIARGVRAFELVYTASDGAGDASADAGAAQRVGVRVVVGEVDLRGVAWVRVHDGGTP